MSLPNSPNVTYANHEAVSAPDLVDMQEQVRAFWRGRRKLAVATYPAYSLQGEGAIGGVAWAAPSLGYVEGGGNRDGFFQLDLEFGARIRQIKVSVQRGGAGSLPWAIERVDSLTGAIVTTLASGSISPTIGVVTHVPLFVAPFPAHPVRRSSARDTITQFRLRDGGSVANDRCYGIEVWYDFPVGAPTGDSLTP